MTEDGFSIKDLDQQPDHKIRAGQFINDLTEVAGNYPDLTNTSSLE